MKMLLLLLLVQVQEEPKLKLKDIQFSGTREAVVHCTNAGTGVEFILKLEMLEQILVKGKLTNTNGRWSRIWEGKSVNNDMKFNLLVPRNGWYRVTIRSQSQYLETTFYQGNLSAWLKTVREAAAAMKLKINRSAPHLAKAQNGTPADKRLYKKVSSIQQELYEHDAIPVGLPACMNRLDWLYRKAQLRLMDYGIDPDELKEGPKMQEIDFKAEVDSLRSLLHREEALAYVRALRFSVKRMLWSGNKKQLEGRIKVLRERWKKVRAYFTDHDPKFTEACDVAGTEPDTAERLLADIERQLRS